MQCFNPQIDRIIEIGGRKIPANDKYYLRDFRDWDEQVRDWLAAQVNVDLEHEHIFAIEFLREEFQRKLVHPVVRTIAAELGKRFGTEKGTVKSFHSLFPGGVHQAFLIAGLPMQDSCC